MKDKSKEMIRKFLMLIAVIAIVFSAYKIFGIKEEEGASKTVNKDIVEIVGSEKGGEVNHLTKESYQKLKEINNDFHGFLYYPSLEINEQVVQGDDNVYYLDHSFYKEYLAYGTVFVDANQNIGDQNTTLYGHWVSNSSLKFSDLHKLKDENNYEKYKTFYYANNEFVYEYEVAIVIYHHSIDDYDNIPYWQGNYTEAEFTSFIKNAQNQAFYDTGVNIDVDDKVMTLQTCITADSDERLVVIGKQVSKTPLADK